MSIAPSQPRRGARRSHGRRRGKLAHPDRSLFISTGRGSSGAPGCVHGAGQSWTCRRCSEPGQPPAARSMQKAQRCRGSALFTCRGAEHNSVPAASPARLRSRYAQSGSARAARSISAGRWQLLRPGRSRFQANIGWLYCSALPLLSVRLFQFPAFWITWGIGTCCTSVFSSEFRRCYNYWGLWWSETRRNQLPCESRSWKKTETCRAPAARIEGFESPFIPGEYAK